MKKVLAKHFQYTGVDDFDRAIDVQITDFLFEKKIMAENIVSLSYSSHDAGGVNSYSALLVYQEH